MSDLEPDSCSNLVPNAVSIKNVDENGADATSRATATCAPCVRTEVASATKPIIHVGYACATILQLLAIDAC
jgi:hypothetical protein